jgi:protein O-mannosyl-transferase
MRAALAAVGAPPATGYSPGVGIGDRRGAGGPGAASSIVSAGSRASGGPWWAVPRRARILVAVVIAVAFGRSLANGFSYDEQLVIVQAQGFLKSTDFWVLLSDKYFSASLEGTWRPFCTLTYMLDALVAFHPAVFKAQSVLWHIGASWLVMALARRLLPEPQRRFALVAGLVFALHPLTTETVDNASFREDSLVTFWTLAAVLLALGRRRWLALGAFVLGLLSKESAVVAPALLALIRLTRPASERPAPAALARELGPFAVVAAAYLAVRFGPMNTVGQYALYPGGSLSATLLGMPAVWAHYLRLLVLPWPLCADYTGYFPFGRVHMAALAIDSGVVLAYVAAIAVLARRGYTLMALGLGWFALALGPVSNFIPVPIPAADRFLYLPLAGIALAASAAAAQLWERTSPYKQRRLVVAGAAVLVVFTALTNLRHGAWRDDATLWADTVAVNPRSCGAQSAVGGTLLTRGIDSGSPDLLRDAVSHQELALRLCPDRSDQSRAGMIYTRLGAANALLNRLEPAHVSLERAMKLSPRYALPVVWMGYVYFLAGQREQAASLLKYAIIDLGPPDSTVAEVAQRYVDKI